MRRKRQFRVLLLVTVGALLFLTWWLGTPAIVEDTAPLPHGSVSRPVGFGRALTSRVFLNLRLDLDTLEKGIVAAIPPAQKITSEDPKVDATLKIRGFHLQRVDNRRLGASAKVQVDGGVRWGIFSFTDMALSAQGEMALSISPHWEWQIEPSLAVTLGKVDARPGLPDWLVKQLGNLASSWLLPGMVKDITQNLPPPKFLVQEFWNQSRQKITVLGAPRVEVSSEPVGVLLRQPVLDASTNDLDLGLGVGLRLLADVSAATGLPAHSAAPAELPSITTMDSTMRDTSLLLPLMLELSELQRHFPPQNFAWEDGNFEVGRVELSEKDGILHARLHFDANLPSTFTTPLLRQISGVLSFHLKPGCDPATGRVKVEKFDFAPATDSRLVNLVGSAARESLKKFIEQELPGQFAFILRDIERNAQVEANRWLLQQRDALAVPPHLAKALRSAKLEIAGLRVRPHALQAREGFLLLVVKVEAVLGITLE